MWVIFTGALEDKRWSAASSYVEDNTENHRTFGVKWFLPDGSEPIDDFKRRVRCEVSKQLDFEIEATEKLAEKRGWAIRPSGSKSSSYTWLAQYQVLGEKYETIADTYPTPQAVHKAVKRLAKFLQLPLRQQIGRPRTKK